MKKKLITLLALFFLTNYISKTEEIYTWGAGNYGQRGDTSFALDKKPDKMGTKRDWADVAAGFYHNVAIKKDGTLWTWGHNIYGQLGDGTNNIHNQPVQISTETNWSKIEANTGMIFCIKTDGTLWSCGWNESGQLGDGTTSNKNMLVQVGTSGVWSQVSSGYATTLAIRTDGTLWAWGNNENGQLGDGTTENKSTPIQIGTDNNWAKVEGGWNTHSMAIKTNGTLWAWGNNNTGLFGDGTTTSSSTPVQIGTETNWLQISCGKNHVIAIKTNGTLWAWGNNNEGQLGDGTTTNRPAPVQIGNGSNWKTVSNIDYFTVALKYDGSLWAWGKNETGQLGDGTTVRKTSPVQIGTSNYWKKVLAGGTHSIGIFDPPPVVPVVITTSLSEITAKTAFSGGFVDDDGGAEVTARGVCWSTSPNPTISDNKTSNGTGTGPFVSKLIDLNIHTKYYVRAYATNSAGTGYGNEIFFTSQAELPKVSTSEVTEITSLTAVSGGNVTYDGGVAITARGVCWSLDPLPSISGHLTNDGTEMGEFTSSMTDLIPLKKYNVRAYATNSAGTAYGVVVSFTTLNNLPSVKTEDITGITTNSAVSGGIISSEGEAQVTERGVCWSVNKLPTIADNKTSDGEGIGNFTSNLTGILPNTAYYVRAYAMNSYGVSYGEELNFKTKTGFPVLTTLAVTDISKNSVSTGGNITETGGAEITARGVCWSAEQYPTISTNKTSDGTGSGSFISSINNFNINTVYYVRAYATNSEGTSYGNQVSFMYSENLPVLSTAEISSLTTNSAVSGGNISFDGGEEITARGVCWSASGEPAISDSKTIDGSGTGTFTSTITGLKHNTIYFVKAYATNLKGTAYGQIKEFKTKIQIPDLISPANNQTEVPVTTILKWNSIEDNAKYRIQVSVNETFDSYIVNEVVSETEFNLYDLNSLSVYYWRLQTVFEGSGESEWSETRNFTTKNGTSVLLNNSTLTNILTGIFSGSNSNEIIIKYIIENSGNISLSLYNSLGMLVYELIKENSHSEGEFSYNLNTSNLPSGVYFISVQVDGNSEVRKMLVY